MSSKPELDELGDELERRFRTRITTLRVGGQTLELLHPANADDLITEADYVKDERLPYWADIWPSSTLLAARVMDAPGEGRELLELGCGLGLVATAASLAGYTVTATDYYEDALLFARVNAWRNAKVEIATRMVDWRHFPSDVGTFHAVVASDVLYEREYATLLAAAIERTLEASGVATVADPGRVAAPAFIEACEARGLITRQAARLSFEEGPIRQTIDMYEISQAPARLAARAAR